MKKTINIIDLFAGPGGLGEGFSACESETTKFKIRMSVEREESAHRTLTLRALYRLLKENNKVREYYDYIEGRITKDELTRIHSEEWDEACNETLFQPTALGEDNERIHRRLVELKKQYENEPWVVIGGPPCQAYSLAGRARNKGIEGYEAEKDHRHFLYQEYLNVLSIMQPDIFVMENVKGILSSKINGELIFPTILSDLKDPGLAVGFPENTKKYTIYSFIKSPDNEGLFETSYSNLRDFVIRAEDYGIPQARHRVILLGVAQDITALPKPLEKTEAVTIESVLGCLPPLRSMLSKQSDSNEAWKDAIVKQVRYVGMTEKPNSVLKPVFKKMKSTLKSLRYQYPIETHNYALVDDEQPATYSENNSIVKRLMDWLLKDKPSMVLHHRARSHMSDDLGRYFFSACWAAEDVYGNSEKPFPKAADYPMLLAPNHANWSSGKFADRFRVQRTGRPATTITSHISKDGHYYIHYDPTQCRSLTVREAARIQTFPDNYFFEGNRTQQYVQVGNAVPPYLATRLAETVVSLFDKVN